MPEENHHWAELAQNTEKGRTILVLGPEAVTMLRDGVAVSLQSLLIEYLTAELQGRGHVVEQIGKPSLAYIAKQLEDVMFLQGVQRKRIFTQEDARVELKACIVEFYKRYDFTSFPVYRQLARMPFHFIVETSPTLYLEHALNGENKFDAKTFFYHYANPTHNNSVKIADQEIREDAPLIYQLFGSLKQPDSMVVTERDQLSFLDAILQQEHKAGIPNSVAIHFTSVKNGGAAQFDKTFVFLGFDFNE